MLPNIRFRPFLTNTECHEVSRVPVAKLPPKYTNDDWNFNNKVKFCLMYDQERLSEHLLEKSRRVVDEANETAKDWRNRVEYYLGERRDEIRFLCDELNKQKKTALLEDEALNVYRNRVLNAIKNLREQALDICQRCLVAREGRLGVDLCEDEVDRQLRCELKVIKGCQALLDKTLKECTEQIRKLRATMYSFDEDLAHKENSFLIDGENLILRESHVSAAIKSGRLLKPTCAYTLSEWEQTTYKNLEINAKELTSAGQMRACIDNLLKQICVDMQKQTERTNEAFDYRITIMKSVKRRLEDKHADCTAHIEEMHHNIDKLLQEKDDMERALALCQVRLSNRARREGLESTCDTAQLALNSEFKALQAAICKINQRIAENRASVRYLQHVQIMQEEEINIKANSIKIDEVDCVTIRQALKYTTF